VRERLPKLVLSVSEGSPFRASSERKRRTLLGTGCAI